MTRRTALFTVALALGTLALQGCNEDRIIERPPPGFRQDVFAQDAAAKIDVLWVVDNSASMQPEQEELATSFTRFMELFSRGQVDYRIAVTTTDVFNDEGLFIGNPEIVDPSLSDPVAAFQKNVKVGTGGKGHEEAFEAARRAIDREKQAASVVLGERAACVAACPGGGSESCKDSCAAAHMPRFMRPEAHLYIIFVSDEDEQSFGEIRYYQRYFEESLGTGNEGAVSVAVIVGDVPSPPCDATAGTRYVALAQAMSGIVGSICDATFDKQLEKIALDAAGLKRKFGLSKKPDTTTLEPTVKYRCDTPAAQMGRCDKVERDCAGKPPETQGILCTPPQGEPNGWTFEISTNALFFQGDSVPGLRSVLVVSYQAADGI
ncbi:MAG: vWA domain-containing protein [Myxococcales bacterium]